MSVIEPAGLLYGSELALLDLLEVIDRTHFELEVVLPDKSPLSYKLRAIDVSCIGLLALSQPKPSFLSRVAGYVRLLAHWLRNRPDLVYINQAGVIRPIAALAGLLRFPIVCQVQTLEDGMWVSRLKHAQKGVQAFICNSYFIAAHTRVPQSRRSVLYHGYKAKGLFRSKQTTENGQFIVGVIGRICKSKGHDLIIKAAKELGPKVFDRFIKFVFIGQAPNLSEEREILDLIRTAGVGDRIILRGYHSDLSAELAEIDLLAIPSRAEPLGRVLFEAAEAGIPAIVSDSGGVGEVARHFGVGTTFKSGSYHALARQIRATVASFETTRSEFRRKGAAMLTSLDLRDYVAIIEHILVNAAARKCCSIEWTGRSLKA